MLTHGGSHVMGNRDRQEADRRSNAESVSVSDPSLYLARKTFLSNFPTLVLGISETIAHRSGTHHFATRVVRNARRSSMVAVEPCFSTTQANGRSSQRSSGTPMTPASATSGCAIN